MDNLHGLYLDDKEQAKIIQHRQQAPVGVGGGWLWTLADNQLAPQVIDLGTAGADVHKLAGARIGLVELAAGSMPAYAVLDFGVGGAVS